MILRILHCSSKAKLFVQREKEKMSIITFCPAVSQAKIRFAANHPTSNKEALQKALYLLNPQKEDIQTFDLPPDEQIPRCVSSLYQAAVSQLSPVKLQQCIQQGLIGYGEESADLLCYVLMKIALQTGALTRQQLDTFNESIGNLFQTNPQINFEMILNMARQSIQPGKAYKKMAPYLLPDPHGLAAGDKKQVEDFLVMLMADSAIRTYCGMKGGSFSQELIQAQLVDELRELKENVTLGVSANKDELLQAVDEMGALIASGLTNQADYQAIIQKLVRFVQNSTGKNTLSLADLLLYNNLKSNGRLEIYVDNEKNAYGRKLSYGECKQISKPYEKLLEAYLLLKATH